RTASINGAFVALVDALTAQRAALPEPGAIIRDAVAAVSVGLVGDVGLLGLGYREDREAAVDLNLVLTGRGAIVEVQGSGEEATFSREQLERMLNLGKMGIDAILRQQRKALGKNWPLD